MPADDTSRLILGASLPNARRLEAASVLWYVYEVAPDHDGPSLVFENPHVVRRVRNYPKNWHDLPDEELAKLIEQT